MRVLMLRFDASLVSFGAPAVDQHGVVQTFPALSLLTGLLANAIGWNHSDGPKIHALQERLRYAARIDRTGESLLDYQTVDLSLPWMRAEVAGWTTRGQVARRAGASADTTHIRYRHYHADSLSTLALAVTDDEAPSLDDLARAVQEPARPLFIGRKCCLPAAPIFLEVLESLSLVAALAATSRPARADRGALPAFWWDGDPSEGSVGESTVVPVTDERDWRNGVHVGRRLMRQGYVDPPEVSHV